MTTFKIGDKVTLNEDKYNNSTKSIHRAIAGTKYIVNDMRYATCNCITHNKWVYLWVGHIGPSGQSIKHTCSQCQNVNINDSRIWFKSGSFTKNTDSESYIAQLELIKLLANKSITPEAYNKLMSMMEGDIEMLELGKRLLEDINK